MTSIEIDALDTARALARTQDLERLALPVDDAAYDGAIEDAAVRDAERDQLRALVAELDRLTTHSVH